MKKTQISDKETFFEDWSIIAFFSLPEVQKKYQLQITPFNNLAGRVAFRVRGDLDSAIADIFANRKVPINDYLKAIKGVRSTIFTLRNLKEDKRNVFEVRDGGRNERT